MKKILSFVLIVIMALYVLPVSAETDPIVGCWYFLYDKSITPEMAPAFNNAEMIVGVYIFGSDGIITSCAGLIQDGNGSAEYSGAGKWSSSGSKYDVSIIGLGSGDSFIENDYLHIRIQQSPSVYIRLHKMLPFDPYSDYVVK